jgi:hypothetical protein
MVAGSYPQKLAPGASGEFPFSINAGAVHGKFTKIITVTTNDPLKATFSLSLKGEAKSVATLSPPFVTFGMIAQGSEAQERRVKVTAATDTPLHLTLAPGHQRLKVSLEAKVPNREYEVVVRLEPPFTAGPLNETVTLSTDDPRQKSLTVKCNATIQPRLGFEPASLRMNEVPQGQPFKGVTHLKNRGTAPVKVLECVSDAPEVKVAVHEIAGGHDFEVAIEAPGDYTPPPQGLLIHIKTDDPEQKVLTFPLLPKPMPPPTPPQLLRKPAPADGNKPAPADVKK